MGELGNAVRNNASLLVVLFGVIIHVGLPPVENRPSVGACNLFLNLPVFLHLSDTVSKYPASLAFLIAFLNRCSPKPRAFTILALDTLNLPF